MTGREKFQLNRLIKILHEAQQIADRLELTNGIGCEIGSLIGSIADELETSGGN